MKYKFILQRNSFSFDYNIQPGTHYRNKYDIHTDRGIVYQTRRFQVD